MVVTATPERLLKRLACPVRQMAYDAPCLPVRIAARLFEDLPRATDETIARYAQRITAHAGKHATPARGIAPGTTRVVTPWDVHCVACGYVSEAGDSVVLDFKPGW